MRALHFIAKRTIEWREHPDPQIEAATEASDERDRRCAATPPISPTGMCERCKASRTDDTVDSTCRNSGRYRRGRC